ncbi:hypothetical protein Lche_0909 [Legionella cherrii]|uniref:Uncharacterized protein n=1 Tax=Legionella cherrii TaxID=28084 RepID=A0A0W0S6Y9_9GAMM|nr:hypothetical protein [Legionella cherrii]KTC78889.1 hypothetical protein Lche_0909 [Legionella cherrii]
MGSIHLSPDEHLKRVMGNPSDAILKQHELSEATYPLLVSYLGWLRRLNGVQNKNDVIRQNEQIFSEFIHLCEHNLLFFLTVTGRFDVIRKLFEDKDLFSKERALLDEIEKEHAKAAAAKLQDFVYVPRKKESTILQQPEEPKPHRLPASEWEKSLYGLTNIDLYQYYEEEMKRITYVHHIKHIKLMDTTYEEHMTSMRKALDLIVEDERINEVKKQKAIAIYQSIMAKKEEMETELNHLLPLATEQSDVAMLNIEIIEKHRQLKEEKLKEVQEILEQFFEEMRDESPQLKIIYEEHQENIQNFKKESQTIQLQWEQEMQTLSTHYENARVHALEDISSSLNSILDELKKCPVDELDKEQVSRLDAGIRQLKLYKDGLKKAEGYEATQLLLSQCNKELETIAGIVQPVLPEDVRKRFELNVNLMKQMIAAAPKEGADFMMLTSDSSSLKQKNPDEGPIISNPTMDLTEEQQVERQSHISDVERLSMGKPQATTPKDENPQAAPLSAERKIEVESLIPVVEHSSEMPQATIPKDDDPQAAPLLAEGNMEVESLMTVVEHKTVKMPQATTPKDDNPHANPLSAEGEIEVESLMPVDEHSSEKMSQDTLPDDKKLQATSLPEEQRIEAKLSTPEQEIDQSENQSIAAEENPHNVHRYRFFMNSVRDGTEFITFDPEKQRHYESMLKELSSILKELQQEYGAEVLAKIQEIEALIKDAKSIGFDRANPSHIQKICDACDLGIDYEPLDHVKDSLSSIIQLKNNPQSSVGM